MKSVLHTILLVFLSIVVFYTGIGATVTNYCCPNCKISYSILGERHQCYKLYQKEPALSCCHQFMPDECCADSHITPDTTCCTTSRISVDLDSHLQKPQIKVPFIWILSAAKVIDMCRLLCSQNSAYTHLSEKGPPLILNSDYLSVIQVFII